jgi:hypothetical protein
MVIYKGKHKCPACGKANKQVFCSNCEIERNLYYDIQIAEKWASSISIDSNSFAKCKSFAQRHNYRLDLLIVKLNIQYNVRIDLRREDILELINMEEE